MLGRLHTMPEITVAIRAMSYGQLSTYQWSDERGERLVT